MTEKRFVYNVNKNTIEQDGKFVAYMNSVDGVRIANKLNILQKENEQLKRLIRKSVVERLLDEFEKSYKDLEEENEQLRKREMIYLDKIRGLMK